MRPSQWAGWEAAHKSRCVVGLLGGPPPACKPLRMTETAKSHDPGGLREGEVAVALPEQFDASLYFIGRIHAVAPARRVPEECPRVGGRVHHRARSTLGRRSQSAGERKPHHRAVLDA